MLVGVTHEKMPMTACIYGKRQANRCKGACWSQQLVKNQQFIIPPKKYSFAIAISVAKRSCAQVSTWLRQVALGIAGSALTIVCTCLKLGGLAKIGVVRLKLACVTLNVGATRHK